MPTCSVRVYLRAEPNPHANVRLSLLPLNGTPSPYPTTPIDVVEEDWDTCRRWIDTLVRASIMGRRQRMGRHIKAHSVELMEADLDDTTSDMRLLEAKQKTRVMWASRFWPIPASLELQAAIAMHFLCLLRGRIAGGAIPADVWQQVVLAALPCVLSFRYEVGGAALPKVELRPWPKLPAMTTASSSPQPYQGQQRDVYTNFAQDNRQLFELLQAGWRGAPRAETEAELVALS